MSENEKHDPNDSSFSWEGIVGVLNDVITIRGQTTDGATAIAGLLARYPELAEKIVERLKLYIREGYEYDGLLHFRSLFDHGLICRAFAQADGTWFAHTYHDHVYGHSEYLDKVGDQFGDYDQAKQACLNHLKAIGYFRTRSTPAQEDNGT